MDRTITPEISQSAARRHIATFEAANNGWAQVTKVRDGAYFGLLVLLSAGASLVYPKA